MTVFKRWGLLITALLMLIALPQLAGAADKGGPKRVFDDAPVAPTSWTGIYVGGNIGMVAGIADPFYGVDGYQFGGRVGYDLQINRLVLGAFAGYDWKTVSIGSNSIDANELSFGGRAGVLVTDDALLYAVVFRPRLTIDNMGHTDGIGFGGGLEVKMTPNWSVSGEYNRETFSDIGHNAREHVVRFGVNYHIPANLFGGR